MIARSAFIILMFCCSTHVKAQQDELLQSADSSVLKIASPNLTYLYNQNHVDVYEATPDNMKVIKPDSSNHFTMPVAGKTRIIQLPLNKHSH